MLRFGSVDQTRVVDDVDAGGDPPLLECDREPQRCTITGEVTIVSGGGTLHAVYLGHQGTVDPYEFWLLHVPLAGSGRFADVDPGSTIFSLGVGGNFAEVRIAFEGPGDNFLADLALAPSTFSLTVDPTCASGQRLQTRISVQLAHLGKTSIVDSHCTRT